MNAKQYFSLLCFIFTIVPAHAQYEYKPMVVEGAHWFYDDVSYSNYLVSSLYAYVIQGDTTVEARDYKKLYKFDLEVEEVGVYPRPPYEVIDTTLIGLIREDIESRKVWMRFFNNSYIAYKYSVVSSTIDAYKCFPSEDIVWTGPNYVPRLFPEILLFDFSLVRGNEIDWCYMQSVFIYDDVPVTVDSVVVNTDNPFDEERRSIYTYGYFPVEHGDFVPHTGRIIEGYGFEQSGLFLDVSGGGYCSDDCGILSNVTETRKLENYAIVPNPVMDHFAISADIIPSLLGISIYDVSGRLVRKKEVTQSITVSDLQPGVYTVVFTLQSGNMHSKRMVVTR